MKKLFLLPLILICLFSLSGKATVEVHSTFITTNDGLGNNLAQHIFQDSKGFIWFSTLNGLTRYDGHSFITLRPEKGDDISMINHHVERVYEDQNHFLWLQISPEFYSCYDLRQGCFVDFTGCGEYEEKYSNLLEATNGDIWLWHAENGCRRIRYENESFTSDVFNKTNGKLPSKQVKQLTEDKEGNIWICTDEGLIQVSRERSQIVMTGFDIYNAMVYNNTIFFITEKGSIYKKETGRNEIKLLEETGTGKQNFHITSDLRLQNNWIIFTGHKGYVFSLEKEKLVEDKQFNIPAGRFIRDKQDNLWIYDNKGNIRFRDPEGKTHDIHVKANHAFTPHWCHIIRDSRGLIWIAAHDNGLYIYNPETEEMTHYTYQVDDFNRIPSNSLVYIMEDSSGSIWVSSGASGIAHLSVLNEGAEYIYPEDKNLINYSNTIRLVTPMKNGEIWVSNYNGDIYKYNQELNKLNGTLHFPVSIYKLTEDKNDKLWIGSRGNGLCIDGVWYMHNPDDTTSLAHNRVNDIYCDFKDRMWVGTFGGGLDLAIPHNDRYTFRHFLNTNTSEKEIRVIRGDNNGWMWVGTDNGLYVFYPDSLIASPGSWHQYSYKNNKLLGDEIKYIFYDSKERMWIGTLGGGFSMCKPGTNYSNLEFTHYTTQNGLVNDVVQAIIEDKESRLWIATEYGISRFSPETETFENFFFSNTSLGNIYSENSVLSLPDGQLLFGSSHGMIRIDPEKIQSPKPVANIALTDLKMNGISVTPKDDNSPLQHTLSYTEALRLKHDQNSFAVEFSTFDYSVTQGTRYSYKLENFDKEWSIPSSFNFAAYKSLPSGTYYLYVKACNTAGLWSGEEQLLEITILPPFWKTGWAYIIYLLLTGILVYIAFRIIQKFNTLHNNIQIEKQLTEYKLIFFTNISHEFRTPLTLIQGAVEKIKSIEKIPEEMTSSLQLMGKSTKRMLQLVNQLLEFRKMQNNKLTLSLEEEDIITFLNDIYINFQDTAREKKINFRFSAPAASYSTFFDKGKMDKIVYNLLSNAFKYTPEGGKIDLTIKIEKENQQLTLSVRDTGIGIPKEKQRELFSRFMQTNFSYDSVGIGLHLTHELVSIHKGTIRYEENPEGGSVFIVSLPLNKELYEEKDFLIPTGLLPETFPTPLSGREEIKNHTDSISVPLNDKQILIIEDDKDIREMLKNELGNYFNVSAEADGTAGLTYAQNNDTDLIICDVLMPGMNGFEVTRKLRENFETSHIPIILLTAMSTVENQVEGIENGADVYLTKPFSPQLLLAHIFQIIQQREKLKNKFSSDPAMLSPTLCTTELDKKFADRLKVIMEKHIDDPEFTIDRFAAAMNLGRSVFFRKVKGVTGYSPNEYMRTIRMKKAMELLLEGSYNVSEISYMIGMKDPLYFGRCFKTQFGAPPSVYLKSRNIPPPTANDPYPDPTSES